MEEGSKIIHAVLTQYFLLMLYVFSCEAFATNGLKYRCPVTVNPDIFFSGKQIDYPLPDRASKTLPSKYFEINLSSIEGAGLGIFSTTFFKKGTWLGEYEGDFVPMNISDTSYAWEVHKNDEPSYYVDAGDVRTSNWLRYINCARYVTEQNVKNYQCAGRMYYITILDIAPATELLVYYGPNYASLLGIDVENFCKESFKFVKP